MQTLSTFVEIDVPGTPVRIFEPIQMELSDHSVVEVVRVDNRVSAQLGHFLTVIDIPAMADGPGLADHVRRAFDTAKVSISCIESQGEIDESTSIDISVSRGNKATRISCTKNL